MINIIWFHRRTLNGVWECLRVCGQCASFLRSGVPPLHTHTHTLPRAPPARVRLCALAGMHKGGGQCAPLDVMCAAEVAAAPLRVFASALRLRASRLRCVSLPSHTPTPTHGALLSLPPTLSLSLSLSVCARVCVCAGEVVGTGSTR